MHEEFLSVENETRWRQELPIESSVFGSVEFARIVRQYSDVVPRLYVLENDRGAVAYPLLLRPIRKLPFAGAMSSDLFDALSPEYTGPVARQAPSAATIEAFSERFAALCRSQGIVAEYAHLHPWRANVECLAAADISLDREIVYVDLQTSDGELWRESFTHACRKNINRARRENIRVFEATAADDIRAFHRIYVQTMERRQAQARYYFPLEYFMALFEQLSHHGRYVLAEYKNEIVAGTLYLYDDSDVYSYLGGADEAFQQMRPTNAVVYDTIQWGKLQGKRRLILGGGHTPDDGIFRFKASFSPLRAGFQVYRHVHLREAYDALCVRWAAYHGAGAVPNGYFPAYRAVPER